MAPFNQRQIGYIQAIAGRQQHRTLKCAALDATLVSDANLVHAARHPKMLNGTLVDCGDASAGNGTYAKSLLIHHWNLDRPELGFDSRAVHNNAQLQAEDYTGLYDVFHGNGDHTDLGVFDAAVRGSRALVGEVDENLISNNQQVTGNLVHSDPTAQGELVRNVEFVPSTHRATEDGFLNSTNIKFRFTLPGAAATPAHNNHPMGEDHYEFRWIVWRSKRPTMAGWADDVNTQSNLEAIRDGVSMRNFGYDFFMGQTGRKRGLCGYTLNEDLDKEKVQGAPNGEVYCGYRYTGSQMENTGNLIDGAIQGHTPKNGLPDGEQNFTVDDIMTMRINRDDYVVMKDVRFFLGKEHGKSHFEDTLHWDWNDPIDTPSDNVLTSPTLNNKNYRWHMTLFGTTGTKTPVVLNTSVRWTTKMESG